MDELRSWWEVPSIAHFCSLFRVAFNLFDFEIEELEEAFLAAGTPDGSPLLTDLLSYLLAGCYNKREIRPEDLPKFLYDILTSRYVHERECSHPIDVHGHFNTVPLRTKVEIVHAICDYRLDAEDVWEQLKGLDGDNLRLEPLGKDSSGALYWYFYGSRLYKEIPPPQPKIEKRKRKKSVTSEEEVLKVVKIKKKKRKKLKKKVKREEKKEVAPSPVQDGVRRSARVKRKVEDHKYQEDESGTEDESGFEESEEEVVVEKRTPKKGKNKNKRRERKSANEEVKKPRIEDVKNLGARRSPRVSRSRTVTPVKDKSEDESEDEEPDNQDEDSKSPAVKTEVNEEHGEPCEARSRRSSGSPCPELTRQSGSPDLPCLKVEVKEEEDLENCDSPPGLVNAFSSHVNGEKLINGDVKVDVECDVEKMNTEGAECQTVNDESSQDITENKAEPEKEAVKAEEGEQTGVKTETVPTGSWSLRCSTVEEWTALADSIKESANKCERDLYKTILEDFLPEIPRLIEEKEKLIRKRLMDMAPRRLSTRIEKKAEVDRAKRQEWLATLTTEEVENALRDEEDTRVKRQLQRDLDEKRRKDAEKERVESEKKAEEDRIRAKEERAERLKLREERARLIAEGKFIPPEFSPPSRARYKSDYVGCEFPVDGDTHQALKQVMGKLVEHHDAWLFRDAVDEEYAPGYYEVIDDPMDLATMKHKLASSYYGDASEFAADFKLIIDNCIKFNGFDSQCSMMAAKLERAFHFHMNKYVPQLILEKSELSTKDPSFREFESNLKRRSGTQRAIDKLQKATNSDLRLSDPPYNAGRRKSKVMEVGDRHLVDLTGSDDSNPGSSTSLPHSAPKLSTTTDSLKHRLLNQFMQAKMEKERTVSLERFKPYSPRGTGDAPRVLPSMQPIQPVDPVLAASVAMTPTTMYPKQQTRYISTPTNIQSAIALANNSSNTVNTLPEPQTITAPSTPTTPTSSLTSPTPKKDGHKRYTIQTPYGSTITLNKPQRPETPKPVAKPTPPASPQVAQASIRLTKAQILGLLQQSPSLQKQLLSNQAEGKPMVISNQQIYETISSQLGKIIPAATNQTGQQLPTKLVMRVPVEGPGQIVAGQGTIISRPTDPGQPQLIGSPALLTSSVAIKGTAPGQLQGQLQGQRFILNSSAHNQQSAGQAPRFLLHNTATATTQIAGQQRTLPPQAQQQQTFILQSASTQQGQQTNAQQVSIQMPGPQRNPQTSRSTSISHTQLKTAEAQAALQSAQAALQKVQAQAALHKAQGLQNAQTQAALQSAQAQAALQKALLLQAQQQGQQVVRVLPLPQTLAHGNTQLVASSAAVRTNPPQRPLALNPDLGTNAFLQGALGTTGQVRMATSIQPPVQPIVRQTTATVAPQVAASVAALRTTTATQASANLQRQTSPKTTTSSGASRPGTIKTILAEAAAANQNSNRNASSASAAMQTKIAAAPLVTQTVSMGAQNPAINNLTVSSAQNVASSVAILSPQKLETMNLVSMASNRTGSETVTMSHHPQPQQQAFIAAAAPNAVIINTLPAAAVLGRVETSTAVLTRVDQPTYQPASGGYPKLVHHYPIGGTSFVQLTSAPGTVTTVQQGTETLQQHIVLTPTNVQENAQLDGQLQPQNQQQFT